MKRTSISIDKKDGSYIATITVTINNLQSPIKEIVDNLAKHVFLKQVYIWHKTSGEPYLALEEASLINDQIIFCGRIEANGSGQMFAYARIAPKYVKTKWYVIEKIDDLSHIIEKIKEEIKTKLLNYIGL